MSPAAARSLRPLAALVAAAALLLPGSVLTLVARHGGDMMGEVVLAMAEGLRVDAPSRAIAPYPTRGEVWKRIGDARQRTRLSPGGARWFARRFRAWR